MGRPCGRHAARRADKKLQNLQPHVLRAKGVLRDADGAYVLHLAGGLITTARFAGKASGHFVIIGKPQMPDAVALRKSLSK